jgi:hypothetical protein
MTGQRSHSLIPGFAATEVNHYNILNDRLNIDDARVMTIGWILGVLFTFSQAIVVFFHLDGAGHRTVRSDTVSAIGDN